MSKFKKVAVRNCFRTATLFKPPGGVIPPAVQDFTESIVIYRSSDNTLCGFWFDSASTFVPDWTRICARVKFADSFAKSASRIEL